MAITLFFSACAGKARVDLIVFNAKVYTIDSAFALVSAFAVKEGRIVQIGSDEDILGAFEADTLVDAEGKFVYPGFIDAHSHFVGYAMGKMNVDLRGTTSFDEVLQKLEVFAATFKPEILQGRGWDQNDWPVKEFPDGRLLDSLFPDLPVYLVRIDGHAAIVNSAMMKLAGISEKSKVDGGVIVLKDGAPTGVLIDNAMNLVMPFLRKPGPEALEHILSRAQHDCFSVGLTTVADAGLDKREILILDSLQKADILKICIYAMLNPTTENYEQFIYKGRYITDRLKICSVKIYADGALGSRGACLLQPYSDDPENYGIIVEDRAKLKDICLRALNYGYQVNVHAIGDSGVRTMLRIFADVLPQQNEQRWRIEHAQVVDPEDRQYFGRYAIIPSVQPTHATSDMYWAGERLGTERVKTAYAYRDLMEQNHMIAFGTDFPIEEIDPLLTFCSAVFRRDAKGWPEQGWQMENAVSREDALRAMTIWAAYACFLENDRGSLEAGKKADFVIMDTDLLVAQEAEIRKAKVISLYLSGEKVYQEKAPH